jgi:LuxR family maltose regulon positive regulatory protein
MQQARQIAQQHPLADLIDKVTANQAELALAQGQLEAAIRWAETNRSGWAEAPKPYEVGRALASAFLAQDKLDEALKVLDPLRSQAEATQQVGQTIQLMIRQALALQAQDDLSPAMTILKEALWLARPGGYMRTFVDQGPALAKLLAKLTELDDETNVYRQKLLAAFPQDAYAQPEIQHPPLHLTQRERQVLNLVATGMTNQQIADELVIARGTVKKHLDNIYAKLGVGSRTQALARATELDLL